MILFYEIVIFWGEEGLLEFIIIRNTLKKNLIIMKLRTYCINLKIFALICSTRLHKRYVSYPSKYLSERIIM